MTGTIRRRQSRRLPPLLCRAAWILCILSLAVVPAAFSATTFSDCTRKCETDRACRDCCHAALDKAAGQCGAECDVSQTQCHADAPSACKSAQLEMDKKDAECKKICPSDRGKIVPMSDCDFCLVSLAYKKRDRDNCVRAEEKVCKESTAACKRNCRGRDAIIDADCVPPAQPKCPYDCQRWNSRSGTCIGPARNGCGGRG